jgi:putative flippase GtrA
MYSQLVRFAFVGLIATCVDAGVLTLVLAVAPGRFYLGRIISFLIAATAAWWLNRRFTFRQGGPRWQQWRRYLVANLGGGIANYAVYIALIEMVPFCRLYPAIAVALGAVVGFGLNFAASRWFVFKRASLISRAG